MAAIRGKNTKPELLIRRGLHKLGFRYRLHATELPGKPDMVFPKYNAVIFVNGCFWHGHNCHHFKQPVTRKEFWQSKIDRNRERDSENKDALKKAGWRILIVWECSLKGKTRLQESELMERVSNWISGEVSEMEVRGED